MAEAGQVTTPGSGGVGVGYDIDTAGFARQIIQLGDATSLKVAIKAASTAAVATDVAMVVAISPNNTVPVSLAANQSVNNAQIAGVATSTGNGVSGTGVQRVAIVSDNTAYTVNATLQTSTTGTISSVTAAITSTTILASNTSRKAASIYNDSTAILYLSLSATAASTTVYSVQVAPGGYFELPNTRLYTGQLTGIWSAANGAARVTELT